jgi:transcriptional regulator with XRE-family HTH domain
MSTQSLTAFHIGQGERLRLGAVAKSRGGKTPRLGEELQRLRQRLRSRKSFKEIARRVEEMGMAPPSASTIHRYEKGRPPDAGVLWALARVYGVDFDALMALLISDLLGQTPAVPIEPTSPSPDAAAVQQRQEEILRLLKGVTDQIQALGPLPESPRAPARHLELVPAVGDTPHTPADQSRGAREVKAGRKRPK